MIGQSKIQKPRRPKWEGLFVIVVALTVCEARAQAQQQGKMPKIGWLEVRPDDSRTSFELFKRELRALGYVDGRSIAFEYRNAGNNLDRLHALADELVRLGVNLVFAVPAPAAIAAKNATRTIPIVFVGGFDPIAAGLVDSLARPGGNITGFTSIIPLLAGKRLELLKETVPKLSRVAALWDPQNAGSAQQWKESQLPARELGLRLHSVEVNSAEKFAAAFKDAAKANSGAIILMESQFFYSNQNQKQLADLAAKNRLPAIYSRADFAESGGLMSYGADQSEPSRRVASMVDKIIKGTKPADIPVEQPKKFEFIVNLKAAKQIGLTIPPNVLARADKVIR
jgi:putative tryptophan/tyrosine transport system substrate-binding protein